MEAGLGIKYFKEVMYTFKMKQAWRIMKLQSVWVKLMVEIHG
jgi:hypothetical protein